MEYIIKYLLVVAAFAISPSRSQGQIDIEMVLQQPSYADKKPYHDQDIIFTEIYDVSGIGNKTLTTKHFYTNKGDISRKVYFLDEEKVRSEYYQFKDDHIVQYIDSVRAGGAWQREYELKAIYAKSGAIAHMELMHHGERISSWDPDGYKMTIPSSDGIAVYNFDGKGRIEKITKRNGEWKKEIEYNKHGDIHSIEVSEKNTAGSKIKTENTYRYEDVHKRLVEVKIDIESEDEEGESSKKEQEIEYEYNKAGQVVDIVFYEDGDEVRKEHFEYIDDLLFSRWVYQMEEEQWVGGATEMFKHYKK